MNNTLHIRDVCSRFSSGKSISADKVHNSGKYPVYGGNGLRGFTDSYNFDGECAVIGRQGAYCGNVKFFSGKGYMTEHAIVAVANNKNNTRFLSYKFAQMNLGRYAGQSAQPGLSVETLLDVSIDVPSKDTQDRIASVLDTIDSKIFNNNAICADLEAMAKLLYDYWFVQFDFPDPNGKPYKSSGGKMVWNEQLKREIPEGWEVKRLGALIEHNRGISYTGNDISDTGTPIISLASIDRSGRYIPDGIKYYNQEYPSSRVLKPFDLIMANTDMTQERAVMGKIIFVPDIFDGDILSTHHITQIHTDEELKPYLMMTTQTDWFHNYIKGFSSGTNVLGMDMIGFEDYMLLRPQKSTLVKFNDAILDFYRRIFSIYKENFELANLRDFLLPMLMNGQVKV